MATTFSASICATTGRGHTRRDLTTREGNAGAVSAAVDAFGGLDVVVANAGHPARRARRGVPRGSLGHDRRAAADEPVPAGQVRVAVTGRVGPGRFIVVASVHALVASPYKAAYVSAKHGVLGLVKTLALEGAEAGITATAVCPGYVRTPLVEGQLPDQAKAHGISEERGARGRHPRPARGQAPDRAGRGRGVIAFLAGPSGAAFTGVPVTMDLGWSAR